MSGARVPMEIGSRAPIGQEDDCQVPLGIVIFHPSKYLRLASAKMQVLGFVQPGRCVPSWATTLALSDEALPFPVMKTVW